MQDSEKIKKLIRELMRELGENPDRPGLVDTPNRVAKMYKELFRGYDDTQKPKVTSFMNGEDGMSYKGMVIDEGNFYSHCEHHMVPFFGKYFFAYIPHPEGKILGLSKVARVVDYFSAKLQIQERLVQEIVDYLWEAIEIEGKQPLGMALFMRGKHLCKSMRGAKKEGWMVSNYVKGAFKDNQSTKEEFLKFIKFDD
jgi:GTP cyclohydrolase IA